MSASDEYGTPPDLTKCPHCGSEQKYETYTVGSSLVAVTYNCGFCQRLMFPLPSWFVIPATERHDCPGLN